MDHMFYFLLVNVVLALWSFIVLLWIGKKAHAPDAKIIAESFQGEKRYFIDYAFTTGLLYCAFCLLLFVVNAVVAARIMVMGYPMKVIEIMQAQTDYYNFLAGLGLSIALLILPERSKRLAQAQPTYFLLSLWWLCLTLITKFPIQPNSAL